MKPLVKDAPSIHCKIEGSQGLSNKFYVISNTYVHVILSQPDSHFPEKHHAPCQLTPTGTGSEPQTQFNRQLLQQGGLPHQVNTSYYRHNEA